MRMKISILMMLLAGPYAETRAAVEDASQQPAEVRPYLRYITSYHIEDESVRDVVDFWINSLSRRPRLIRAARISKTLQRINLEDYAIQPEDWEAMLPALARYTVPIWAQHAKTKSDPIGTVAPVILADEFLYGSAFGKHYYRLLGIGDNFAGYLESRRFRKEDVEALRAEIAGLKVVSGVALHNRRLRRWPTLAGYLWFSDDHASDFRGDNVLDNILQSEVDGGEFIASLPNGLQEYTIANAAGKILAVVPANIAQDYETPARDKQIYNAFSCVGCHSDGIKIFSDDLRQLIDSRAIDLKTKDKSTKEKIEDRHLLDLASFIRQDQARFSRACLEVAGMEPEKVATLYRGYVVRYIQEPITKEIACRELGITPEQLPQVAEAYAQDRQVSGTVARLLAGQVVPRFAWADEVPRVMSLLVKKGITE